MLVLLSGLIVAAFVFYPRPLQQKLAAVGYGLDPQRPSHTYTLGELYLPLEARKTGMFGGFLLTCCYFLARGRARAASFPRPAIVGALLVLIGALAVDGLNATLFDLRLPHLYSPDLRLRLASGLGMGVSMAALLVPAVNGSFWRDLDLTPALASWRDLAGALTLNAAFFAVIDGQLVMLYYLVALLSVGGLVAELTLINMVFVLVLGRRVASAEHVADVVPIAAAAFVLSAIELVMMSIFRTAVLGTAQGWS